MREYYADDAFSPYVPVPDADQPWVQTSPFHATLHGPLGLADPSTDGQGMAWDPAEELAFLLQEAREEDRIRSAVQPPPPEIPESTDCPIERDGMATLAGMTASLPPTPVPPGHGRRRARAPVLTWARVGSFFLAALSVTLVSTVSVFSGIIAYDPLREVAQGHSPTSTVGWWPLLVYGPWAVASLSVLRAALHQRRAAHSWAVVLLFSFTGMLLCVTEAPRNYTDMAVAALPTVASLACFQQMVRFITLTRPPRRTKPRHRNLEQLPPRPAS
ncbi:DUF2637 domain-containing protein [Streptomyces lavendulocolor]|uniref:DUF2637 domain-containing protein n=1 Tax=Streptomyces lavendulocolor TaxID=67316 RepID=UPI003C2D2BA1